MIKVWSTAINFLLSADALALIVKVAAPFKLCVKTGIESKI